jgi:hypothetical protein
MPPKEQDESLLREEVVVTPATPAAAENNVKSDTKPNKFVVELTLIADPKVNDDLPHPVTKYHLQQQTIAFLTINGEEFPTIRSRSLWLKLSGDNPLQLEKDDTFQLDKRNTRLTKSSWLSDPDDPESEVYSTHWVTPKEFPLQDNHVLAEW